MTGNRTDERYWAMYTAVQAAKHEMLKRYLGGWFPALSKYSGRVLYVDSHAGRGRHATGSLGSPLIALTTLLEHKYREGILQNCEVTFIFLEQNASHAGALGQELQKFGNIPNKIHTHVVTGDYEAELRKMFQGLKGQGASIAPSFFFLDPYGFVLPMDLMQEILSHSKTELCINFMVRFVDMAMTHPEQEKNLDMVFGCNDWRKLQSISDGEVRQQEIINLYSQRLGAKYCSVLEMKGKSKARKYSLLHATNHRLGREKMKSVLWKITPHGSFSVYESENPKQKYLITPEPDLKPLEDFLRKEYAGRTVLYRSLEDRVLPLPWDYTHLKEVVRKLRDEGKVTASNYTGRFAFDKNPLLAFEGDNGG